ncbi:hypothetical protein [Azospirillum sp. TSH100]|uniref:hypothetical protein n=1 Tax=Azospirillum sp. TSH100 TaxID=652764 RepID=UPI000D6465F4|nr:hypothetical protein [Azospirillum sp. TSH100]QCG92313.1 hypothetical protein E6C72_31395 [Azospirillum sp. TSH100]
MPALTVTAPVADRSLVTVARVRAELGITEADLSTEVLTDWIRDDSDAVCAACGAAADQKRRRTFLEEAVTITFSPLEVRTARRLVLPWRPALDAFTVDVRVGGVLLDAEAWHLDPAALLLSRRDGCSWGGGGGWNDDVVITGTAGWVPDEVPASLRQGVLRLVRLRWEGKGRDLTLKAISTEGAVREEFWIGGTGPGGSGIPADIMAALRAEGLVAPAMG